MTLRKTLKEHVYTSWDFIAECDDTTFVRAVYEAYYTAIPHLMT